MRRNRRHLLKTREIFNFEDFEDEDEEDDGYPALNPNILPFVPNENNTQNEQSDNQAIPIDGQSNTLPTTTRSGRNVNRPQRLIETDRL